MLYERLMKKTTPLELPISRSSEIEEESLLEGAA